MCVYEMNEMLEVTGRSRGPLGLQLHQRIDVGLVLVLPEVWETKNGHHSAKGLPRKMS